jgi:hypothetical protein
LRAMEMCEVIAHLYSGGTVLTPVSVLNGVCAQLGGLSKSGAALFSGRGLTCARSTALEIIKGWTKRVQDELIAHLKRSQSVSERMDIWIADNYVTLQHQKYKLASVPLTQQAATISLIVRQVVVSF